MKRRIFALVIICSLLLTAFLPLAKAEYGVGDLLVLRPKISLNSNKGSNRIKYVEFGTELELISYEYDYCKVRLKNEPETIGYLYTGYIGYAMDILWLTNDDKTGGVALSILPNLRSTDFGYAAGGKRMSEMAIVLYEQGDYLYVVTNEGCSGFIYRYDSNVISYEEYLWRQQEHEGNG